MGTTADTPRRRRMTGRSTARLGWHFILGPDDAALELCRSGAISPAYAQPVIDLIEARRSFTASLNQRLAAVGVDAAGVPLLQPMAALA